MRFLLCLVALASFVASGQVVKDSATWPPEEITGVAREELIQRVDTRTSLAQKLIISQYIIVHRSDSGTVSASSRTGESMQDIEPPDANDWKKLFDASGFNGVVKYEDEVHFVRLPAVLKEYGGSAFSHIYIKSDKQHSPRCVAEFAEHRCGQCTQNSESGWIIQFGWLPPEFSDRSEDKINACIQDFVSATGATFGATEGD